MDRWEYATIDIKNVDLLGTLKQYGLEGWEAVTIITLAHSPVWTIVFNRRLPA